MKIAISSTGNRADSLFDKRFGRAEYFCIYDKETKETVFFENEHAHANNGAGTKAAEKIVELQAKKAISGDFGPKAKELLDKLNIQMVIIQEDDLTIKDIIDKLN
jgi:predicted Fe-Mo cluster-binding NifX family protein